MTFIKSVLGKAALAAAAMLGLAGAAQAGSNVYWSVGVGSPGVSVGVTNARPVYVQPAPVYYQPQPVYVQPAPVYYQRPAPVYYQPQPVYVQPAPVYYERPYKHRKHHGYGHGHYRQQAWVHGPHGFQPPGYYHGR
ncbi:MAG TPA: hypothetical protein VE934_06235 [Polaromonas sp.]|uniref:hypothetical protein n=1 Tax=Polaromonas sp. TaxID=1869339 RepID=UPI002D5EFFCE|nr:hypothetical protein [Polaromonas sp.]HYW56536.1 hypothetical protein [Polaromonas sp.]